MLPSGLPEIVDCGEDLARFIYSSNHFSSSGPKPAAFLPSKSDNETSVFRHGKEPAASLWALHERACKLYGAAIVSAGGVREVGLDVTCDEPPHRHAVIRGWPQIGSDPVLQKAQQKERALAIASRASFVIHSPAIPGNSATANATEPGKS
jgi:hypothetical protein